MQMTLKCTHDYEIVSSRYFFIFFLLPYYYNLDQWFSNFTFPQTYSKQYYSSHNDRKPKRPSMKLSWLDTFCYFLYFFFLYIIITWSSGSQTLPFHRPLQNNTTPRIMIENRGSQFLLIREARVKNFLSVLEQLKYAEKGWGWLILNPSNKFHRYQRHYYNGKLLTKPHWIQLNNNFSNIFQNLFIVYSCYII